MSDYVPGTDALAIMRRRIKRDRRAAVAEIENLRPLTESRFDGCERTQPDDDARAAVAKLTALVAILDQADEVLG